MNEKKGWPSLMYGLMLSHCTSFTLSQQLLDVLGQSFYVGQTFYNTRHVSPLFRVWEWTIHSSCMMSQQEYFDT